MTHETLSAFFGWLTLLHLGLFTLSALLVLALRDRICGLHGRMFGLAPEAVRLAIYRWLGSYKIVILATALAPWLALQLI
ncbi:DUF6868 family protein [Leisingera sp. XS_AS12]|jgi:hypothetical protein|uniref:DUF6868 family protein n=1 Tax=unclassified Leisingera TaxID=2614906 RepID=UPI001C94DDA4|nr:hypothetical protein [Nocardioides marinus]